MVANEAARSEVETRQTEIYRKRTYEHIASRFIEHFSFRKKESALDE